ncbi:MAG: chorismate-binding protein [Cyclobacteriaceae bacterium]
MDKIRESLLEMDLGAVLPKLPGNKFPYACWKMPNSDETTLIVSLSKATENQDINSIDQGFLFNRFKDSHPKNSLHIKADIIFRENSSPRVNPVINDTKIGKFIEQIDSETSADNADISSQPSTKDHDFEHLVEQAVSQIEKGTFEKVVLSRFKDVELPEGFSVTSFFKKVCDAYPNAFCSLIQIPGEGMWIGASPELLISDNENCFKTAALAGTRKLQDKEPLSELSWTQKEIEEQALVSRYIINCFKKIRLREFDEHGPKTVKAGNLAHLRTEFEVDYSEVQFEGLADQMLDLLHPTSAVCGMPLEAAAAFIESHEGYNRDYYAGFLGPVNFEGSTDLFVNLRCLNITGKNARFYAGAGITADSNPAKEKAETDLKMETLKSLFPTKNA